MTLDSLVYARSDFPLPTGVMRLRRNRMTDAAGWFFALYEDDEPHFVPVDSSQFDALGKAASLDEARAVLRGPRDPKRPPDTRPPTRTNPPVVLPPVNPPPPPPAGN